MKKGVVTIFGGIFTKPKNYRHAIEIYQKNGLDVHFYESRKFFGLNCLIPAMYRANVERAVRDFAKKNLDDYTAHAAARAGAHAAATNAAADAGDDSLQNWLPLQKKMVNIVHVNSGGLWSGLEFNRILRSDAFIIEAGPLNCRDIPQMAKGIDLNYIRSSIDYRVGWALYGLGKFMDWTGIPNYERVRNDKKAQGGWFTQYDRDLTLLSNVHILHGHKDPLIDTAYVSSFIAVLRKNNIRVQREIFENAQHHNVSKSDPARYQAKIQHVIDSSSISFHHTHTPYIKKQITSFFPVNI